MSLPLPLTWRAARELTALEQRVAALEAQIAALSDRLASLELELRALAAALTPPRRPGNPSP